MIIKTLKFPVNAAQTISGHHICSSDNESIVESPQQSFKIVYKLFLLLYRCIMPQNIKEIRIYFKYNFFNIIIMPCKYIYIMYIYELSIIYSNHFFEFFIKADNIEFFIFFKFNLFEVVYNFTYIFRCFPYRGNCRFVPIAPILAFGGVNLAADRPVGQIAAEQSKQSGYYWLPRSCAVEGVFPDVANHACAFVEAANHQTAAKCGGPKDDGNPEPRAHPVILPAPILRAKVAL